MPKNIKHIRTFILTFALVLVNFSTNAQEVRVVDNKGTIQKVNNNNVTTSTTAPTNPVENDVWFDTTNSQIKIYDTVDGWKLISSTIASQNIYTANGDLTSNRTLNGTNSFGLTLQNLNYLQLFSNTIQINGISSTQISTTGGPMQLSASSTMQLTAPSNIILQSPTEFNSSLLDINNSAGTSGQILTSTGTGVDWIDNPALNNWLITGNTGTTNTNFLGTIDDVKMQIRSNNVSMLEFGRRQTLGLNEPTRTDYNNPNQSLVYLNGSDGVSALQFRADGASFYKPMFYTTSNGSFRLKGSSGGTDFFEIGSAGPTNDGRLEFVIADDGNEPIVFKRFDYRNGEFYKEFFRVQGSNATENAKTRFGININQNQYSVTDNINAPSNGGVTNPKLIANSTLQIEGSVSKSIEQINSNTTLNEDHHTVVVTANVTINFPTANTCKGRIYIIKNVSGGNINSSTYRNESNTDTSTINNNTTLKVQSDGTRWVSISNILNNINNNWKVTGNSATNPTNNFIGTTDAQDLSLRTNNTEAVRILQSNQNVGINTTIPSERLDVNGKVRIRDISTVTTNNDILTTNTNGVVEKKKLIASESNNQISTGANGGVYLGPTVYTGAFIINTNGNVTINTLPFQPSQITFVAHANVESFNLDLDNNIGDNNRSIANSFGTMNGFARNDSGTITQQVIYIGGSGNSINDISRFASSSNCIGLRYSDQNGNDLGKITASMTSFNTNGFTINVNRTNNASSENLVVLYTAYK
ncbi:hypothetical protein MHM83_13310 [Tenacibaculum sp. Mcav3-52]|uniref:hypothetical protein n=1 Tax=Tenacibaculum sp. Mcav3-52 TaxID=2917762 RepID=UPI001EF1CE2B|nr:hypothetical protein [Tenacibaculum sp. Mcav3-52]MCG7502842.1 hypothetical protein [Tenacibaculum sp. Mcav3-52]